MKPQIKASAGSKVDLSWANEHQTVWVALPEDDSSGEAFTKGIITKLIDDDNVEVQVEGAKEGKPLRGDRIYPLNNYKDFPKGYDDMVDMENLSEAELLNNLRVRFQLDIIHTYVGPTLIVLNPYKSIERGQLPAILSNFQVSLLSGRFEQKEHPPHVFAIAAMTMKNMFENNKNQAIVISGESGAGKTENTKFAMKFLTSLGKLGEISDSNIKEENIEDKILACNPVLEAFGNAKTVRNDNSSRFGKYVALLVEKDTKKIVGATITNYLLEKSRVVGQNSEERNYHIFYAFLRGASQDNLKKFFLTNNLDDWAFLKNAFKGEVKTVPDVELYKEVTDSFNTMKFSKDEQSAVWTYTAASLMVGNLDFDESEFSDSSNTPCKLKNEEYLKNASKILNVDFEKFSKSLRFKTRVIGNQTIDSAIKRDECLIFRDSLAKELFNKLFNWLVRRLNFTVMPPEFTKGGINMGALMNKYYHIGLLDIFGFEIFNFNSLEQFCINFSNEKLQQLYISYVFKGEEKEFINEGLKDFLCELAFKDNQSLIDMLDSAKLPGIFQMVDESCSVNATDQNLYDKILKQFKKPEFPLTTPKISRDTFIVKHTAKEVEYNINGFRAKNKDEISKTIEDAICSSGTVDIVKIWKNLCLDEVESEEAKNAKPNPKDKFLGYKFRMQMKELMEELNSCECHFIRCLKPNEKKQADFFLPQLVLQQIKYMGILDTIKVRKDSFPIRTPYKNFYQKYQELAPQDSKISFAQHLDSGSDFKEMAKGDSICQRTIPNMVNKMVLYGETKMFFRVEAAKEVERMRRDLENKKVRAVKKFQNACIRFKRLRLLRDMFKGMRTIQKIFRIKKEYLKFLKVKQRTKQIQRWWRRILHERRMAKFKGVVLKIQKWWKMEYQRKRYIQLKGACIMINRVLRGARCRIQLRKLKFCKEMVEYIIKKSAEILFEKLKIKALRVIQRYGKGYACRQKMRKQVQQIKKVKEDFVKNKRIRIIQKHAKGMIVRSVYRRLRKAAVFIQGYMKMMWLSSLFQKLRTVSIIIQKAVKRWYIRRKIRRQRMQSYMNTEGLIYKTLKYTEQVNFFGAHNVLITGKKLDGGHLSKQSILDLTSANLKTDLIETAQSDSTVNFSGIVSSIVSQTPGLNTTKEVDPYTSKKIDIFTKVIDIELLTDPSLLYDPLWSTQILQLQNACSTIDADIQLIEVGQAHTIVVLSTGKVLSFGWNDCNQLGRPIQQDSHLSSVGPINFPIENFRPKSIASGDDHNLLLDSQGNLYIWGDNSHGQLGLGHSRGVTCITNLKFLTNDSINEIKAKGNNSLVVTENGKVYYWPLHLSSGEKIYRPAELSLPSKIQISTASCGYGFAALVSKNGFLFTFGRDNQAGQLGHGDTKVRDTPTLVETLKTEGELVVNVSCGYKHVICKSKSGKVYTWGWGEKGQLGHGKLENESKPKMLNLNKSSQAKALQVQAGFSHSIVLVDTKKALWFGSNASLEYQSNPQEVNFQKKIPDHHKEFAPIKLLSTWSKTMNTTYASLADTRTVDLKPILKQKVLSILINKIEENNSHNHVDLPFIESISKYFPLKTMKGRITKEVCSSKLSSDFKNVNQSISKPSDVGLPRFYDSLSKSRLSPEARESVLSTSQNLQKSLRSSISPQRSNSKSTTSLINGFDSPEKKESIKSRRGTREKSVELSSTRPNNSPSKSNNQAESSIKILNKKLVEIKKKMHKIMAAPMETWSKTDIEFLKTATEPKMLELLQNIKI